MAIFEDKIQNIILSKYLFYTMSWKCTCDLVSMIEIINTYMLSLSLQCRKVYFGSRPKEYLFTLEWKRKHTCSRETFLYNFIWENETLINDIKSTMHFLRPWCRTIICLEQYSASIKNKFQWSPRSIVKNIIIYYSV